MSCGRHGADGRRVFSWSALDAALGGSVHDAQLLHPLQGTTWDVGGIFFGRWLLPLGWFVARTSQIPHLLGWLLLVGRLGYVANTFVHAALPVRSASLTSC